MKKLLLLSLLVLGANSFGAVIGDAPVTAGKSGTVALPIRATAKIVAATGKTIQIESTTAGMNGNMMEFSFGDFRTGLDQRKSLDGTFEVSLADATAFTKEGDTAAASETNVAVSFDPANFTATGKNITTTGTATNGLATGVDIAYAITGGLNDTKTKYMGNVNAIMTIAKSVATATNIADNSQKIYAKVTIGS